MTRELDPPHQPEPQSIYMAHNPQFAMYDVGEWSYGHPEVILYDKLTKLKVGRFCSFAPGVTILLGGEHRVDWVTTYPFTDLSPDIANLSGHPASKGDVIIGNDVWIGRDVMILSGVQIGDGAVVGAGSVVTKSVAPYSIVAGNPARHIRFRFSEPVIEELIKVAWWEQPQAKIKEIMPYLLTSDVENAVIKMSELTAAGSQCKLEKHEA